MNIRRLQGMKNASVIDIQKSNNITVDGFTIYALYDSYINYGIKVWWKSDNCKIFNNCFGDDSHKNETGILFLYSDNNEILNNLFFSSNMYVILIQSSHNNIIHKNTAVKNGIYMRSGSSHNIVDNNDFYLDGYYSVILSDSYNNTISNNYNMGTISMRYADYNFFYNNEIYDYEFDGAFFIDVSNYNTFLNNSVIDSKGKRILYTYYSSYNSYYRNTFESSTHGNGSCF